MSTGHRPNRSVDELGYPRRLAPPYSVEQRARQPCPAAKLDVECDNDRDDR